MTALRLDADILDEVRRFNRKLDRSPRFRMRGRAAPLLIQSLLRMSQLGANARLAHAGIRVARKFVQAAAQDQRVPVRILRGERPARGIVLDIHGGGWVIGNATMNDKLNAALVAACDVIVVSVDYRLAVAHPIGAIMDDCLVAARWLLEGGLAQGSLAQDRALPADLPVFVIGESAGGHLAAATLLRLKAWPALLRRIAGAVLYYGVYDFAGTASVRAAGADTLVLDGPRLVADLARLTPGLSDAERRQAPLSPLHGDLAGLPDALLFAGERDPLRDDTTGMARRWLAVADVELHLLPEAPHGFLHFPPRLGELVRARTHAWITAKIATSG